MQMEINPGYLILTFYLIVAGNFMAPLFSCRLQTLIMNSMVLRHAIGLLTFVFFVGLTNVKTMKFSKIIAYSLTLYGLFVMTTRMDMRLWIPMFGIAALLFLIQTYENAEEPDMKEEDKARLALLKKVASTAMIAIIVFGTAVYLGAKKIEYGSKFEAVKFWLGQPSCRMKSPDLSVYESLKGLRLFIK